MFTGRQLRALMIPLMIEQVLTALMGSVDTMMVTSVGSVAISAVSLVDALNVLFINLFAAMATGGGIICAQYIGQREGDKAQQSGRQLILAVLAVSAFVACLCVTFRRPLLALIFGTVEQAVMENAVVYLLITALSYPFIAVYNAGAVLFRMDGNSRLPMAVSTVSNLVNIALNALMIYGCGMGVAGAAWATLLSRMFSAAVIMARLRQPRQTIAVRDYLSIRPDVSLIRKILAVGVPTGIENGMFQFGKLALQSTVSTMGTTAIAAQAMTSTLEMLNGQAALGIGMAMMTVVGQCVGAARMDEAKKYIGKMMKYAEAAVVISCALTVALIRPITVWTNMEPAAADMAVRLTFLICAVKPFFWTLSFMPGYGLRAAGDVRFSMMVSSVTMWTCRVTIAVVLARVFHMGPLAVWIGMFADWVARSCLFYARYRSDKWMSKRLV